jgi:hypothetical protein
MRGRFVLARLEIGCQALTGSDAPPQEHQALQSFNVLLGVRGPVAAACPGTAAVLPQW